VSTVITSPTSRASRGAFGEPNQRDLSPG
jgi:hypothetical protein